MFKELIIGAVSITSLFMNNVEASQPDENIHNNSILISESLKDELPNISFGLQNMTPAVETSDELREQRRKLLEQLTIQAEKYAEEESVKQTLAAQRSAEEEWKANFPTFSEQSAEGRFINAIAHDALHIAKENNIYPSVMIAQAGLESNWGRSGLAVHSNNLMGTKGSWNGKTTNMRTREVVNGESIYINANFSVYDSWGDSLARYGQLLRNGISGNAEFYSGTWRENTTSYRDATEWLEGRYATDDKYTAKLNHVIEMYDLERFDNYPLMEEAIADVHVEVNPETVRLDVPDGVYEVKVEDAIFSVAVSHDILMKDLAEWNDLKTPILEVGQWLIVDERLKGYDVIELFETQYLNVEE